MLSATDSSIRVANIKLRGSNLIRSCLVFRDISKHYSLTIVTVNFKPTNMVDIHVWREWHVIPLCRYSVSPERWKIGSHKSPLEEYWFYICRFGTDHHTCIYIIIIVVVRSIGEFYNLAVVKVDSQAAKLNYPLSFPGIDTPYHYK